MIRVFEGPNADHVWQQIAQPFRQPDNSGSKAIRDGATEEILHSPDLGKSELALLARWNDAPHTYWNIIAVFVPEASRRHGWTDTATGAMSTCTKSCVSGAMEALAYCESVDCCQSTNFWRKSECHTLNLTCVPHAKLGTHLSLVDGRW